MRFAARVQRDFVRLNFGGIYVRLDRAVDGFPDGVIDDEYFLMMTSPARVGETLTVADAEIWSTSNAVEVFDFKERQRYRFTNGNEDPVPSPSRLRPPKTPGDDLPAASSTGATGEEDLLREVRFDGYGLRHAKVALTEQNLAEWRRNPVTNVELCTAGEPCASGQCSVECSATSSCSVSCNNLWWNACCVCAGAQKKLASCTCVACNTY